MYIIFHIMHCYELLLILETCLENNLIPMTYAVLEHYAATSESLPYKTTQITFSSLLTCSKSRHIPEAASPQSASRAPSLLKHLQQLSFLLIFKPTSKKNYVLLSGSRSLHSSIRSQNTKSARLNVLAGFDRYLIF